MKPVKDTICAYDTAEHAQVDRLVYDCAHNGMQHVPRNAHIFHMTPYIVHASARSDMTVLIN